MTGPSAQKHRGQNRGKWELANSGVFLARHHPARTRQTYLQTASTYMFLHCSRGRNTGWPQNYPRLSAYFVTPFPVLSFPRWLNSAGCSKSRSRPRNPPGHFQSPVPKKAAIIFSPTRRKEYNSDLSVFPRNNVRT